MPLTLHKISCEIVKKIYITQISSGSPNHNNFCVGFSGIALKFKIVDPIFSSCNPCRNLCNQ